jgi:hypothetical protein
VGGIITIILIGHKTEMGFTFFFFFFFRGIFSNLKKKKRWGDFDDFSGIRPPAVET